MKDTIHPQYNSKTAVVCACGNNFTTGSTKDEIRVEVCSNCHPFYTGKLRLVDSAGTVDKFKKKQAKAEEKAAAMTPKKPRKTQAEKAVTK
jgi:large subunit ribosomal protein L31